jgi:hypothetical protein
MLCRNPPFWMRHLDVLPVEAGGTVVDNVANIAGFGFAAANVTGVGSTSGGSSAGNAGGNGRCVVSEKCSTTPNFGTRSGAGEYFFSGQAARDINPFIEVFGTTTHNIAPSTVAAEIDVTQAARSSISDVSCCPIP